MFPEFTRKVQFLRCRLFKKGEVDSFVCRVGYKYSEKEICLNGNSVLVDKDRGLFATLAHLIKDRPFIRIANIWHPANSSQDWINWNADVGILKINPSLCTKIVPAELDLVPPKKPIAHITGYVATGNNNYEQKIVRVKIKKFHSTFGISIFDKLKAIPVATLLSFFKAANTPPSREVLEILHIFYDDFIYVEVPWWETKGLKDGLNGSPFVTKRGRRVIGLIALANILDQDNEQKEGWLGLVTPAHEIKSLLEKIKI